MSKIIDTKETLFEKCKKDAMQGYVSAQYELGNMYELGEGVRKDTGEAIRWYKLAADQGHYESQECLVSMQLDEFAKLQEILDDDGSFEEIPATIPTWPEKHHVASKNELDDKVFIDLHGGSLSNISEKNKETTQRQLVEIYHNKEKCIAYLKWLTEQSKSINTNPQNIKAMQNIVNHASTQRLMLGLTGKEMPTQRVRLMKANKPIFHKELCTYMQLNNKEYLFIVENLEGVNFQEKQIISLRFGIPDGNDMTLEQVGKVLGLTRERVLQIQNEALDKLKGQNH